MALFLRLTIVDDGGIENVIRQEAAMEVGKSKAIPKALWLELLLVGRNLERVGDLATNIAEEVVYLYEAKDIRHTDAKRNGHEAENPAG